MVIYPAWLILLIQRQRGSLYHYRRDLSTTSDGISLPLQTGSLYHYRRDLSTTTDGISLPLQTGSLYHYRRDLSATTDGISLPLQTGSLYHYRRDLSTTTDGISLPLQTGSLYHYRRDLSITTDGISLPLQTGSLYHYRRDLSATTDGRFSVFLAATFMFHFGDLVFVFCALWTVILPVFAVRTELTDQPHVIGSPQPITAAVGDDVILPCHLEPKFNVQGLTVEWSKPDLKPDPSDRLSRVEYVHLYRDRREVPDMKIRSYFRRTSLFTDDLRDGNISLKITNVTLADEGRYKCFIPKLKSQVKDSIVRLVVEPNSVKTWTTETPPHPTRDVQTPGSDETDVKGGRLRLIVLVPVLVLVLILGGGVAGYLLKHKCQKQNRPEYFVAPTEPLPVQVLCAEATSVV
ncbi:uncharacterized protein LOC119482103 [Sebastes umbrosus]|uniref:uncharacterized protein LOC119482103 n=1 Tax=Sebastes umbrosus TaxID=72105 RepID=UPI00189ED7D7|nr:uncharacterized protein LOC119482103 [Sebastes umbrosus]